MSERLEVLRSELDALEAADAYDAPQYDWLFSEVEALEKAEAAGPGNRASAPAVTPPAPDADPVQALVAEIEAAAANPAKLSDEQRDDLIKRYNAMGVGQSEQEATDLGQLHRDMLTAQADPGRLADAERDGLLRRYNKASRGRPSSVTELRTDLDSKDLGVRLEAAVELQRRGEELPEGLVDRLVGPDFMVWQEQHLEAQRDPANYSPELRPVVEAFQAAEEAQRTPVDPTERALALFNDAVRKVRPLTPEETLTALGVSAEPAGEGDE